MMLRADVPGYINNAPAFPRLRYRMGEPSDERRSDTSRHEEHVKIRKLL
jgi:hypothetical protein